MSAKKKVIISMSALVAVFLVAAVAITAVWAARNATVNSGFTISYTAIHVKATITGSYQVYNDSTATNLTTDGTTTTITFSGSEATNDVANVKSFQSVTPVLKSVSSGNTEQAYVDFVYVITNNETTNLMDIALNSDPDTADNNLTYTYTVSLSSGATGTTGTTYNNLVTGLSPSGVAKITIYVSVDNLDSYVNATGTFAFVLTGKAPSA